MLRHVIFDLDGTLVDSHPQIVGIVDAMLAARGARHRVDRRAARAHMSGGGAALVAALLGRHGGDPTADLADFRARYAAVPTPATALYGGVAAGLGRLKAAGLTLSLCSNKPQQLCERVLEQTGLARRFDVIVGARDGIPAKPAPDLLALVVAALGAEPDDCLFVGDSEVDAAAAAALGVPFAWVRYGYSAPNWVPPCGGFDRFPDMVEALAPCPVHA